MARPDPDDPYRAEPARQTAGAAKRGSSSSRRSRGKRGGKKAASAASTAPRQPPRSAKATKPAKVAKQPARPARPARQAPVAKQAKPAKSPPARKRRSRGGRGGGSGHRESQLTSHPTSRNAYVETRAWLLAEHGPVCAYCARKFTPRVMTLDHVAPRKGKTAYDRRDNLVLACPACNALKRDLAPMAFLLGSRERAGNLLRYGTHLSPMLVEMARSLAPAGSAPIEPAAFGSWATLLDVDDEDPYR